MSESFEERDRSAIEGHEPSKSPQLIASPRPPGKGMMLLIVLLVGGIVVLVLAIVARDRERQHASVVTPTTAVTRAVRLNVARVAAIVDPAVVDVHTTIASPIGSPVVLHAEGTGMLISTDGEILTNNHVIAQATQISVSLASSSRSYPARVLGYDKSKDIALLKIDGVSGLPVVQFNEAMLHLGSPIVAIGNAEGRGGLPRVTSGDIVALGVKVQAGDVGGALLAGPESLTSMIGINASIEPGDSGGALLDSHGRVIGMVTAALRARASGPEGFAIPITEALDVANAIVRGTHRGGIFFGDAAFVGIAAPRSSTGTAYQATPIGAYVGSVFSDSPAAQAGLSSGDTVTAIGTEAVLSWSALDQLIADLAPGDAIALSYVDSTGAMHTAHLILAAIAE